MITFLKPAKRLVLLTTISLVATLLPITNINIAPATATATTECTPSTTSDATYTYLAFKSGSCSWTVPSWITTVDVLVVAGGGGGGAGLGGGGGAGGYLESLNFSVTPSAALSIDVGAGGLGNIGNTSDASTPSRIVGTAGSNSKFSTLTALGGGRGAGLDTPNNYALYAGGNGGSGGGGGISGGGNLSLPGSGDVSQGKDGGAASNDVAISTRFAGGGGGAGQAGKSGDSADGRSGGGNGKSPNWLTTSVATSIGVGQISSDVYFAGGGGGGIQSYSLKSAGGLGGGGASAVGTTIKATAGSANTGGGGGGGGGLINSADISYNGADGGSGVVVLRYLSTLPQTINFTVDAATAIAGTTGSLTADSTSGQTVTFSSDTNTVCSISGSNQINYLQTGTCTLTATAPASGNYLQATKTISFTVNLPTCSPATHTADGYVYLAFKTSAQTANLKCNHTMPNGITTAEALIVGGGGGGGSRAGGGGGAGGFISTNLSITSGAQLTIAVGGGGTGGAGKDNDIGSIGTSGSDSFIALGNTELSRAIGGGAGGASKAIATTGGSGGGGAGFYPDTSGSAYTAAQLQTGGTGTAGQGNAGGLALAYANGGYSHWFGGGGGGAGAVGANARNASPYTGGAGGIGKTTWITSATATALSVGDTTTVSGSTYFAGGGSGGGTLFTPIAGGAGGGGTGGCQGNNSTCTPNSDAKPNTGGGGGGSGVTTYSFFYNKGGNGGSGVVVLRYALGYTVTYKADSNTTGTTADVVDNFTASSPATIRSSTTDVNAGGTGFTRTSYLLTGWSTTIGGAKSYSIGDKYSTAANLVLYPVWTLASSLCNPTKNDSSPTYEIYTFDPANVSAGCIWQIPQGVSNIDVLVIGGGGGAGSGGGGAGGFIEKTGFTVKPGDYVDVNIGAGGAGSPNTSSRGAAGASSRFGGLEAGGGGGGGRYGDSQGNGGDAVATSTFPASTEFVSGSGGGGSSSGGSYSAGGGRFNGGATVKSSGGRGGGGGGSSQNGFANNVSSNAGAGGAGTKSIITGEIYASGGSSAGAMSNSNAINKPGSGGSASGTTGGAADSGSSGLIVVRIIKTSLLVCDVNYGELNFDYARAVNKVGTGKALNDKVLFSEVLPSTRCGGVDAIVTTSAIVNAKVVNYELGARAGGANSYFQVDADVTATNGYVEFSFEFIAKGTYGATPRKVILQNVKVTAIDIDANQFNSLSNFDSYTLAKGTRLKASPVPTSFPASAKFQGPSGSDSNSPLDQVVVTYGQVEKFSVQMGRSSSGTPNYYGVAFKELGWGTATPETTGTQYTLTYGANGGTGTVPSSASAGVGGAITVAANTGPVVKSGSIFLGWNTQANGAGTTYAAGSTFIMPVNGATLYALWSPVNYTVSYAANGATTGDVPGSTGASAGKTVTVAGNSGSLARTGYTLAGWSLSPTGSSPLTLSTGTFTMPGNNVTLYAVWTPQAQTITYNANNGSLNPICSPSSGVVPSSPTSALTGATYTIPDNTGNLSCGNYVFTGWNTAANGTGVDYPAGSTPTMPAGGITLYAQWERLYFLTYSANGGTNAPAATPAKSGESVTVAGVGSTSRTGYTFSGWNTKADGTGTGLGTTYLMPSDNVTVYAQWTPQKQSILYNTNGGSNSPSADLANSGSTYTVSNTTPTKPGYSFVSWNTKSDGSGVAYAGGNTFVIGTDDVVLYAQWTAIPFTLTYAANGGVGTEPAGEVGFINDQAVVSAPTSITRSGYTFTGWNTSANGSGTGYASSATFIYPAADVVLYAQWSANPYQITYNGNGATSGAGPTSTTGLTNQNLTTATTAGTWLRTGYTFIGWSTLPTDESSVSAGGSYVMPPNDITWYAQWSANQNVLTYDANSGTGAPSAQNERTNALVTLSATAPTRDGYTFVGWNSTSDGNGSSYALSGSLVMPADNLTLYAQWTANTNTLVYLANGGVGAPSAQNAQTNTTVTLSATEPTRTGYTFAGWNTQANGAGATTYAKSAGFPMPASNTTLYAKWTPINYTLTYNANSGSSEPAATTHAMDSIAIISSTMPNRSGFTFIGWNTASDGSGISYVANDNLEISGNKTIYAQWLANSYTLTYSANGGQGAPAAKLLSTGSQTTNDVSPTRSGYTFAGWYLDADGSGSAVANPYTMPANNVTLYAKWTAVPFEVSYELAGGESDNDFNPANKQTDTEVTIATKVPVRAGYTFLGWGTSQRSARSTRSAGGTFIMPAENVKLHAQWIGNPFNVDFDSNGGVGGPTAFQQATGADADISATAPTQSGYTFSHWIDASTKERFDPGSSFSMPARNVKLLAQWTRNSSPRPQPGLPTQPETKPEEKPKPEEPKPEEKPKPEPPVIAGNAKFTPVSSNRTSVAWAATGNATKYELSLNGKVICVAERPTCAVPNLLGPKAKLEVTAISNEGVKSTTVLPSYAPEKPVRALVVYFDENKFALTRDAKRRMNNFIKLVKEQGFKEITLEGHTDGQGGSRNALNLSRQRAEAVAKYLKRSIRVRYVRAASGEKKPVASNATAAGQAKNRRVEGLVR